MRGLAALLLTVALAGCALPPAEGETPQPTLTVVGQAARLTVLEDPAHPGVVCYVYWGYGIECLLVPR